MWKHPILRSSLMQWPEHTHSDLTELLSVKGNHSTKLMGVIDIIKDKVCTTYSQKAAVQVGADWWLQNRNLSLGKRKKIAMGNENGRECVKMFFSRIKSPFCKHDFACTILPVSSRAAKWMIWWSGVGDNQSRHRVTAGAIEKVGQCRPQKLGSWCTQTCTPAAAQYHLSHSGSAACHRLLSLSSKWAELPNAPEVVCLPLSYAPATGYCSESHHFPPLVHSPCPSLYPASSLRVSSFLAYEAVKHFSTFSEIENWNWNPFKGTRLHATCPSCHLQHFYTSYRIHWWQQARPRFLPDTWEGVISRSTRIMSRVLFKCSLCLGDPRGELPRSVLIVTKVTSEGDLNCWSTFSTGQMAVIKKIEALSYTLLTPILINIRPSSHLGTWLIHSFSNYSLRIY